MFVKIIDGDSGRPAILNLSHVIAIEVSNAASLEPERILFRCTFGIYALVAPKSDLADWLRLIAESIHSLSMGSRPDAVADLTCIAELLDDERRREAAFRETQKGGVHA